MRRPLLFLLTGLVLGEAAACILGKTGVFILMITLGLCLLFLIRPARRDLVFITLLFIAAAFFGALCFYGDWTGPDQAVENVVLTGRVISISEKGGSLRIILGDLKRFKRDRSGTAFPGRTQVNLPAGAGSDLLPDDRILLSGYLNPLQGPTNPGEFDSRIWFLAQGIRFTMTCDSYERKTRPAFSIRAAAYQLKRKISQVYRSILTEEEASLLEAMALGDKSGLAEEEERSYQDNGLAHLLVVSGLHVSLLGGSLFRLLKNRGAGYLVSCTAGSLVLIFYAFMTGFGSSAFRAVIMYLVYLLAQLVGADYDIISAMSLSGILMLVEYPKRLLEGGFQISYLSIFAIGLVLPLAKARWDGDRGKEVSEKGRGKELSEIGREKGLSEKARGEKQKGILSKIRQALFSGLIISGVTAPLLMHIFYEWTPLSIILNLIFLPCMEPLLISAVCGGLAGLISQAGGWIMLLPARGLLHIFQRIFTYSALLPGKKTITGCLSLWQVLALWLLEAAAFYLVSRFRLRALVPLVFLGIGLTVYDYSGSLSLLVSMREPGLLVDMLDVGQGECILVRTPSRKSMLIDCGSISRDKVGKYVILPALKYYGVRKLDYVVFTHLDQDHTSALAELLAENYPIGCLLIASWDRSDSSLQDIIKMAENYNLPIKRIKRGDSLSFEETQISCLHPPSAYAPEDRNEGSVVLLLSWKRFDMLLTGDLAGEGERIFIDYLSKLGIGNGDGDLDVLKVPHHGAESSTSPEFLACFSHIKAALISAGRNSPYGHPHKALLERLEERGIATYKTPESGALHLFTDGERFGIRGFCSWADGWGG